MKILLAEDNRFFRRLLEVNLAKWGHDVVACDDGSEAWRILSSDDSPKLAILDWEMPGMQGVEICREIRKVQCRPYVYIILLTAKNLKEDLVEGLESGADDYITKPFDPVELQVRVRAATRIVLLQEDLYAAFKASELQAKQDSLTGLWNHSAILDLLKQELERANRQRTPLGVIMADVDGFKAINDIHGHLVGDWVLREVALTMKSVIRLYDSVGRYGGDEFLVVVPGCSQEQVKQLAERLCGAVSRRLNRTVAEQVGCTMSMGVAWTDGRSLEQVDGIVTAADESLYTAKKNGRNRVEIFDGGEFSAHDNDEKLVRLTRLRVAVTQEKASAND